MFFGEYDQRGFSRRNRKTFGGKELKSFIARFFQFQEGTFDFVRTYKYRNVVRELDKIAFLPNVFVELGYIDVKKNRTKNGALWDSFV